MKSSVDQNLSSSAAAGGSGGASAGGTQPPQASEADKDRRKRAARRSSRRPKQGFSDSGACSSVDPDPASNRSQECSGSGDSTPVIVKQNRVPDGGFRSLPLMNINGPSPVSTNGRPLPDLSGGKASQSCPLPLLPCPAEASCSKGSADPMRYTHTTMSRDAARNSKAVKLRFNRHWSEDAVQEALKKGNAFKGKFRVNPHNRLEAYCTVDGMLVDVLISGNLAQNRAVDGDVVAIALDPVAYWNKMKGPDVSGNSCPEAKEAKHSNTGMVKSSDSRDCSDSLFSSPHSETCHGNGDLMEPVNCKDSCPIIPENSQYEIVNQDDSARAIERICGITRSYPNKRPTAKVLSIIKMSPRREGVVGFLGLGTLCDREMLGNQKTITKNLRGHTTLCEETVLFEPTDSKMPNMLVHVGSLPGAMKQRLLNGEVGAERELVAVRIEDWDEESLFPSATLTQILGKGGEIETQISAILVENAINCSDFSSDSLACIPHSLWRIPEEEFANRIDLRHLLSFTIDPSSATDFDDALSVEMISDEILRVGVHIADVSYFVQPDTALDAEAQIRSTSVYVIQHKVPMLPRELSEELASLAPGLDRLAISITWDINRHGNIVNRFIGRTVISSCCNLSYDIVQDIIDADFDQHSLSAPIPQVYGKFHWDNVVQALRHLYEFSKMLNEVRHKDGALHIDNFKPMFLFDENGIPYDSWRSQKNEAFSIVEELMLLANRTVAGVISNAFPHSALLRKHPEPNLRKLRELEAFCLRNDLELDVSSSGQFHHSLSKIREKLNDDPVLYDILMSYASKPMQAAMYFCTGDPKIDRDGWAHYALSFPSYTHFTSPLRRYPDIVVHRTLCAVIEAEQIYLKGKHHLGIEEVKQAAFQHEDRLFTGLHFDKDAAETKEMREALSVATTRLKILDTHDVGKVAEYCNDRKMASRRAEDAVEKVYLWALLKQKEITLSNARVVGLGPRFMSVYVPEFAIERRILYDDVDGLSVEWLETTGVLLLDIRNDSWCKATSPKTRQLDNVALVINPTELPSLGDNSEDQPVENSDKTKSAQPSLLRCQASPPAAPAFFPLVLQYLSAVPVVLTACGGNDGPLDISVRLYMCSYLK